MGRISGGFEYQTVLHVTVKSLANDEEPETEALYDKPLENKKIVRRPVRFLEYSHTSPRTARVVRLCARIAQSPPS